MYLAKMQRQSLRLPLPPFRSSKMHAGLLHASHCFLTSSSFFPFTQRIEAESFASHVSLT
jgi:hypothetical protein